MNTPMNRCSHLSGISIKSKDVMWKTTGNGLFYTMYVIRALNAEGLLGSTARGRVTPCSVWGQICIVLLFDNDIAYNNYCWKSNCQHLWFWWLISVMQSMYLITNIWFSLVWFHLESMRNVVPKQSGLSIDVFSELKINDITINKLIPPIQHATVAFGVLSQLASEF